MGRSCYSAAGKDQRPFQGKEKEGTRPDGTAVKPAFSTQNVGCSKRLWRGTVELRAVVLGGSYSPSWSVRLIGNRMEFVSGWDAFSLRPRFLRETLSKRS